MSRRIVISTYYLVPYFNVYIKIYAQALQDHTSYFPCKFRNTCSATSWAFYLYSSFLFILLPPYILTHDYFENLVKQTINHWIPDLNLQPNCWLKQSSFFHGLRAYSSIVALGFHFFSLLFFVWNFHICMSILLQNLYVSGFVFSIFVPYLICLVLLQIKMLLTMYLVKHVFFFILQGLHQPLPSG